MDQEEFRTITGGFLATPVEDLFYIYKNDKRLHWYHLLCSIEDFKLIWFTNLFKFYSLCRCHQKADNNCFTHEHVHAIVSCSVPLSTWKRRLIRHKIRLCKTTFKKILCGDHLCGIVRYICCEEGLNGARKDADGRLTRQHIHYERMVDVESWLHPRGKRCLSIRKLIEFKMKIKINVPLHDYLTCTCDRGLIGERKRKNANKKRRDFYNTPAGKLVKQRYKDKKEAKKEIIQKVLLLVEGKGDKAELRRENLESLLKSLL